MSAERSNREEADVPYLNNAFPVPAVPTDGFEEGFYRAAREGRLTVQRCAACGGSQFPPEIVCRVCQSDELSWVEIEPVGTVFSHVRVWHPVSPEAAQQVPFVIGVIDVGLPGARFVGNILGDPLREIEIGAPVKATFEQHDDHDVALVQWTLLD